MNRVNSLPMALTVVGLGVASAFAEVKLTDNLGVSGFLDASASGVLPDSGDATLNATLDQFELDFLFKYGSLSARADVNAITNDVSDSMAVSLEQGFVTYTAGSGLAVTSGRFLSAMGFEAAEPTGLYQYSASLTTKGVYAGYQNGLALSYTTPMFGVYGAVVTDLWTTTEFDLLTPGFEAQVALTPMEGVTAKVGYLYQMYDGDVAPGGDESQSLLNAWASYAKGPITAAGEFNLLMDWGPGDLSGFGFLVMANFKATEHIAATLRYSALSIDDEVDATDDYQSEVTFSPSLALTPNWLVLAEGRYDILPKATSYALESLFSF